MHVALFPILAFLISLPILSFEYLRLNSTDFLEQIRIQREMDFHAFWWLAKIALGSLVVKAVVSALLFLLSRWRRIRVFITFHHDFEQRVLTMRDRLNAHGVDCDFIPFDPRALHDNVLARVTSSIRWADLVITVPGREASFVDSEVLSATMLQKPLLIFRCEGIGRTLDTAYEGYPRFSLECLEKLDYRPIAKFIKCVCNHWSFLWIVICKGLRAVIRTGFFTWGRAAYRIPHSEDPVVPGGVREH